jgi:RNA polymerase sigma-70 factor (ECF subfamily)
VGGVELDDLTQQAADDALVAVLAKLDGYRGASRFTTWAYKFAVLEVSVKLQRHAWRGLALPTADDDPAWDRLARGDGADARLAGHELVRALRDAVAEVLTPRQREVFVAAVLHQVPADVLAERLGSTRGAVYKTVHDARRKLWRHLAAAGHVEPMEAR